MIKRTDRRMVICITLLVLNIIFIWGNSLLNASVSGALSHWVQSVLNCIFKSSHSGSPGESGLLRKAAHFTEFCSLAILLNWLFTMLLSVPQKPRILTLMIGFVIACTDETIQLFIPGRNGSMKDVGIDMSGVIVGILFLHIGLLIHQKFYNTMEETK